MLIFKIISGHTFSFKITRGEWWGRSKRIVYLLFLPVTSSMIPFVSGLYTAIRCVLMESGVGVVCPFVNSLIDREGNSGMWQSIQFCFKVAAGTEFNVQKLWPASVWQFMQRCENTCIFVRSVAWGLWQDEQFILVLWIKHWLPVNNWYWVPWTSSSVTFGLPNSG